MPLIYALYTQFKRFVSPDYQLEWSLQTLVHIDVAQVSNTTVGAIVTLEGERELRLL